MLVSLIALTIATTTAAAPMNQAVLPAEWLGEWQGELIVYSGSGKTQRVPITLSIKPLEQPGEWAWKTTYAGKQPLVKDYKLVAGDRAGQFIVDEGNGIRLDSRLDDTVLLSVFDVGESVLTARYELVGKTMRFEVTSARKIGERTKSEVQRYEVIGVQRAELTKR